MIISAITVVMADGYRIVIYVRNGENYYSYDSKKLFATPDTLFIYNKDIVCSKILTAEIDSIIYSNKECDNTIMLNWDNDKVYYVNPIANDLSIQISDGSHVTLNYTKKTPINILVTGHSDNGSLKIDSKAPLSITIDGLQLESKVGEVINVKNKVDTEFNIVGTSTLSDHKNRPEIEDKPCKACLYTKGNLTISGNGTLNIKGNYANAIQSGTNITIDNANIKVDKVAKNAFSIDQGVILANNCNIEFRLTKKDTKGFKTDSLFIQKGGKISMSLLAKQCKGIKAKKGIIIENSRIEGTASGGVVIEEGDPSYCTFIKCDSDIVLSNAELKFFHNGSGGKCISADSDIKFSDSSIEAILTGDGGCYVNVVGEDDYYTPRVMEAGDSLSIISGNIDLHCTGIGGKGMVCDHNFTIGELGGNNEYLSIRILTEGTSIVNDTIADFRKGCPKAIKSSDQLDILSGNIYIKTMGMGGEGLESKNDIWMVGGNIVCETFDDGVNGEHSINIYGGNIYACSQDNDGFDSNGVINIYGGNIFSVSLNPINESFDTEGNTLNVYGGNILGIGGGTVVPEYTAIPLYTYPRYTSELVERPMPEINLFSGSRLSILDGSNCVLSGLIPADMKAAIVTVGSANLKTSKEYKAVETTEIEGESPYIEKFFFYGGSTEYNSNNVKFSFNPKYYDKKSM